LLDYAVLQHEHGVLLLRHFELLTSAVVTLADFMSASTRATFIEEQAADARVL